MIVLFCAAIQINGDAGVESFVGAFEDVEVVHGGMIAGKCGLGVNLSGDVCILCQFLI